MNNIPGHTCGVLGPCNHFKNDTSQTQSCKDYIEFSAFGETVRVISSADLNAIERMLGKAKAK